MEEVQRAGVPLCRGLTATTMRGLTGRGETVMPKNVPSNEEALIALSRELVALSNRLAGVLEDSMGTYEEVETHCPLQVPDPSEFPTLTRQLASLPVSRFDSLLDFAESLQHRIIDEVLSPLDDEPSARDALALLRDRLSVQNEKYALDLAVYAARGENDIAVLVDRPSGAVMFLCKDKELLQEEGPAPFQEVELDLPRLSGGRS